MWCTPGSPSPPSPSAGYNTPSVCSAQGKTTLAYACMDWNAGSTALERAAANDHKNVHYFYGVGSFGSDASNMGKCYKIKIEGVSRTGIFQVINQGGDVSTGQFDLQMGDGGFGIFNGCANPTTDGGKAMYNAPKSAFGNGYGGWSNESGCDNLPMWPDALESPPADEKDLREMCHIGFQMGLRGANGENPRILSAERTPCPDGLVALTGLKRTDEGATEVHGTGKLTRMMDCCKPSSGWIGNTPMAAPSHPAVIPCGADGFTRLSV